MPFSKNQLQNGRKCNDNGTSIAAFRSAASGSWGLLIVPLTSTTAAINCAPREAAEQQKGHEDQGQDPE
ncbi:MAG: hypothetical protein KAW02_05465 [candidate division Zixibacteria bacterium]|nr:hypothetical protein [candidate division Zixibacteria bacterium]